MAPGWQDILVFEVAGQRYGFPGRLVRELVRAVHITPLPHRLRGVEGVVNLRGKIVPVLDLRHGLDLPGKSVEPSDHLIVMAAREHVLAFRVDRALELTRLETEAAPATALAKSAGDLVPVLDVAGLLEKSDWPGLAAALSSVESLRGEGGLP